MDNIGFTISHLTSKWSNCTWIYSISVYVSLSGQQNATNVNGYISVSESYKHQHSGTTLYIIAKSLMKATKSQSRCAHED